jgi:hypothetical protein
MPQDDFDVITGPSTPEKRNPRQAPKQPEREAGQAG